jgi:hypothetical protein
MVAVTSYCSATLLACAAQHRFVGSSGTIAVCSVWATGRRWTVAALQPPLSTRLAGAWCLLVPKTVWVKRVGARRGHAVRITAEKTAFVCQPACGAQTQRRGVRIMCRSCAEAFVRPGTCVIQRRKLRRSMARRHRSS